MRQNHPTAQSGLRVVLLASLAGCAARPEFFRVRAPVADLRATATDAPTSLLHDEQQETQLLYGERVRVRREQGAWAFVGALEQAEFTHHGHLEAYPGWVRRDALEAESARAEPDVVVVEPWAVVTRDPEGEQALWSVPLGARLFARDAPTPRLAVTLVDGSVGYVSRGAVTSLASLAATPRSALRQRVIDNARRLVGTRYRWGGRSPPRDHAHGTDCSGLVNLAYRAAGVDLPRDAHEQSMRATTVRRPALADLVFLSARADPLRVVHVMLYAGDDALLEAPGTGGEVRVITARERLGRALGEILPGDLIGDQTVTFGSFLQ